MRKKLLQIRVLGKYFLSWFVFLFGQTWVQGIDAILRLRKPMILNGYFATQNKEYSVAIHGLPEESFFLLTYFFIAVAVYLLFKTLKLHKWGSLGSKQKIIKVSIFSFSLILGLIVHFYLGLEYVLGTGIDSL